MVQKLKKSQAGEETILESRAAVADDEEDVPQVQPVSTFISLDVD